MGGGGSGPCGQGEGGQKRDFFCGRHKWMAPLQKQGKYKHTRTSSTKMSGNNFTLMPRTLGVYRNLAQTSILILGNSQTRVSIFQSKKYAKRIIIYHKSILPDSNIHYEHHYGYLTVT